MAVSFKVGPPVIRLTALWLLTALSAVVHANTVTVVISGLGGNAEYEEQFNDYATRIADEARRTAASPQDVILIRGDAAKRSVITALLENLPVSNQADTFRMFLIGHGSVDGQQYKFNIPGPDITGEELAAGLENIQASQQLIVVSTSSSGALLEPLAAPNRVVVTATKNAREKNAVRFTRYLVDAITDSAADTNKNESISAQEMYDYALAATEAYYQQENLLAPEHAVLNGDIADRIEVARYGVLLEKKDEIDPALLTRRQSLATEIESLRARKDDVDEDQYFDKLQELMLELAEVQRTIDTGGNENAN